MKLSYKLFLSYLLVIGVSLLVLSITTAFIAPQNFSQMMMHDGMLEDQNEGGRSMMGSGMMGQNIQALDAQLNTSVRTSVNNALLLAGGAAVLTAVAASWFVSQRIVQPVRALVSLSHHIASGHYDERLNVQTHDELDELTDSFNRMAAALSETETMRRQLIADVSHELKTPLASIRGYMEGLQDHVLLPTPETFQLIHREATRLQRLVQDLQELSRVEAGQTAVHPQPLETAQVVQGVVERMRPQFAEKNIALQLQLSGSLPNIYADHDRTEQILTNLLGNALQYTEAGGTVAVGVVHNNHLLHFTVHDSGIGLKAEDSDRIFQRFYRVDKSRSRSSGGSGIGLTITRHLVEAQGGRIWAESSGLGQGSTFHFTLPAV